MKFVRWLVETRSGKYRGCYVLCAVIATSVGFLGVGMEGDLIATIRAEHAYIGHYHTGGVPGRHELDSDQEINWPAVCRAIVGTAFQGYVAHEFVPTRDPLTSLREAVALCDV